MPHIDYECRTVDDPGREPAIRAFLLRQLRGLLVPCAVRVRGSPRAECDRESGRVPERYSAVTSDPERTRLHGYHVQRLP